MADEAPKYPEHEKLAAVRTEMRRARKARWSWPGSPMRSTLPGATTPVHESIDDMLYEHFKIDAKKIEQERHAMLEAMRQV